MKDEEEGSGDGVVSACDDDNLVLDLNLEQLQLMIEQTSKLVVEFWKPSCPACVQFKEEFEQAAKNSKLADTGIVFGRVNTANCPDMKQDLGIFTYPRVLFWADGLPGDQANYPGNPQRYFKKYGLTSDRLINWLKDRANYASQGNTPRICHGNTSFFDQFQCDDGSCIPATNICDMKDGGDEDDEQCEDESDEKFCLPKVLN